MNIAIKILIREQGVMGLGILSYARMLLAENGGSASVDDLTTVVAMDLKVSPSKVHDILSNQALFVCDKNGNVKDISSSNFVKTSFEEWGKLGAAKRWKKNGISDEDNNAPYIAPIYPPYSPYIAPNESDNMPQETVEGQNEENYDDMPYYFEEKEQQEEETEEEKRGILSPTPPIKEKKEEVKEEEKKEKEERIIAQTRNFSLPEQDALFIKVWDLYGKKSARATAFKAWKRLTEAEKQKALEHIPLYVKATPELQFRPYLSTYLNQRRFEEQIISRDGHVLYDPEKTTTQSQPQKTYYGGLIPQ